jgi:uncharacterized protein YbjT (DUF2867 family)
VKILVTGISGYIGGAIAPRLVEEAHEVRGLSRDPSRVGLDLEVIRGDVATGDGIDVALEGIEVAYYLAHSLESGHTESYAVRDRRMARNFVAAARRAGVRRVIHLGVFDVDSPAKRSAHQSSRLEVDGILRSMSSESLTLRCSAVIGASNWYFKALVNMARRLPVIALPKRGKLRLQPIDERDAVRCLVAAATSDAVAGRAVDIAGDEIVSQREFMRAILQAMGTKPRLVGLPFAVPSIFSRGFAAAGGGDPAILVPLFYTGLTDNVAREDGAALLGVQKHSLQESLRDAIAEMGFAPVAGPKEQVGFDALRRTREHDGIAS